LRWPALSRVSKRRLVTWILSCKSV